MTPPPSHDDLPARPGDPLAPAPHPDEPGAIPGGLRTHAGADDRSPSDPAIDEAEVARLNAEVAREARITATLESKSYSRLAWERFLANTQAVIGAVVVLFLSFVGVFAPLLANSLPYQVNTIRSDLYEQAYWVIAVDGETAIYDGGPMSDTLRGVLRDNYALMRRQVAGDLGAALDAWWAKFEAAAMGGAIDVEASEALIAEYNEAFDPEGAEYVAQVSYPALRTLRWSEVAFMAAFVWFITLMPLRRYFGGPARVLIGMAVFAALVGLAWQLVFPPVYDQTNYKALERDGVVLSAIFPPVRYGENENITEQVKEPPTWSISPEKSARKLFDRLRQADHPADESTTPERWRELRLQDARATTARALQSDADDRRFAVVVEGLGLTGLQSVDWTLREEDRRWARLHGLARLADGSDLPVALAFTMERGNWRMAGFDVVRASGEAAPEAKFEVPDGDWRMGSLEATPTTDDYHWLGTDANGRDLLARMIYGTRIAMSIGVVAVSIYCLIGIVCGALAGFYGGWVDIGLSRFIEVIICFPTLFLILILVSFGSEWPIPPIFLIMVVIGVTGWPPIARLVRGEFLRLSNEEFVQAVRAVGGRASRIIFKHVLPNAMGPVLVSASFGIASAILYESSLSFIGLGVKPPQASWGLLLFQAREDLLGMWWMTMFPGVAIFVTVTCFNLVGEGVRDALDPKHVEGA
jgi:ABC-type dipeptide/oligopeptide/nickel transport system permease subunit